MAKDKINPVSHSCPQPATSKQLSTLQLVLIFVSLVMDIVFGYLANEIWLRDYAREHEYSIDSDSAYLARYHESSHPFVIRLDELEGMREAARNLIAQSGIHASLKTVWISNCKSCFCWSIPQTFRADRRTPQTSECLERFKNLVGAKGEPSYWTTIDGDVPENMLHQAKPKKEHWQMSLESFDGGRMPIKYIGALTEKDPDKVERTLARQRANDLRPFFTADDFLDMYNNWRGVRSGCGIWRKISNAEVQIGIEDEEEILFQMNKERVSAVALEQWIWAENQLVADSGISTSPSHAVLAY
ncbi:hypothetical protein HETIRDRAFT_106510 [Heterobasidion irregulare TC 32-1]|uniref:Uncharacterized protein n=1 Tax=Heterobasidion irregulare (strain TC 32-1) TaxID=747525 RepID=W4JQW9_HETIT|nr:uncharacterized protein HETIRDRAFT_106510 [Heterobasidion irregulare TC 32-1]ETW75859.1 hypothetical protein HETIRDRAFT_106510 [Heterobasidion irregulare TC 32-1]